MEAALLALPRTQKLSDVLVELVRGRRLVGHDSGDGSVARELLDTLGSSETQTNGDERVHLHVADLFSLGHQIKLLLHGNPMS
jgi:hypothetical protein